MRDAKHPLFRWVWWSVNAFLAALLVSSMYAGIREYSARRYLKGFADAVVPESAGAEQKVEAILAWMRNGPARNRASEAVSLAARDPEATLNYQQLLEVCGTATNAFLNLARSSGLSARRLLLLTPEHRAKHVVAEVQIGNRWVIVDPAYRVMLRNAQGQLLTRSELKDQAVFNEAIGSVPGYSREYDYERTAHVRVARLPLEGMGLQRALDRLTPGWDEASSWSLLLERESFLALVVSTTLTVLFFCLRMLLGWYADRRLKIPRYRLREHARRAGLAFFSTPEIEQ